VLSGPFLHWDVLDCFNVSSPYRNDAVSYHSVDSGAYRAQRLSTTVLAARTVLPKASLIKCSIWTSRSFVAYWRRCSTFVLCVSLVHVLDRCSTIVILIRGFPDRSRLASCHDSCCPLCSSCSKIRCAYGFVPVMVSYNMFFCTSSFDDLSYNVLLRCRIVVSLFFKSIFLSQVFDPFARLFASFL
jgi:hypothetical protein